MHSLPAGGRVRAFVLEAGVQQRVEGDRAHRVGQTLYIVIYYYRLDVIQFNIIYHKYTLIFYTIL